MRIYALVTRRYPPVVRQFGNNRPSIPVGYFGGGFMRYFGRLRKYPHKNDLARRLSDMLENIG